MSGSAHRKHALDLLLIGAVYGGHLAQKTLPLAGFLGKLVAPAGFRMTQFPTSRQ